jgi:hypothetical protein
MEKKYCYPLITDETEKIKAEEEVLKVESYLKH